MDELRNVYTKTYYFATHFKEIWSDARQVCKWYGFDLMSFDMEAERRNFTQIYIENYSKLAVDNLIGAVTSINSDYSTYTWVTTGKQLNFPLDYIPYHPTPEVRDKPCLSVNKLNTKNFGFTEYPCNSLPTNFFCEQKALKRF